MNNFYSISSVNVSVSTTSSIFHVTILKTIDQSFSIIDPKFTCSYQLCEAEMVRLK